jgi:hypothetical protein
MTSFDVRFWQIETRPGRRPRVRWVVARHTFAESFTTKGLAEAFRAKLITAARDGEAFSTDTGLPQSMERKLRNITLYQHALEFTASTWPTAAAKTRVSIIESLTRVIPVVTRDLPGTPDPDVLRSALRKTLNQAPTRTRWTRTRPRPSPGSSGHPDRSARSKTPPSSATSSTPWPSGSTASPPAPNTSPAAAASCTNA